MLKYIQEQLADQRIRTMRTRLREHQRIQRTVEYMRASAGLPRVNAQIVHLSDLNPSLVRAINEGLGMLGQVGGDDDDGPADNPAASPNPSLN